MTLSEKISASDKNLSNRFVKTAFYVSKEIIWGIFFQKDDFFLNLPWYWANNFRPLARRFNLQNCQKYNLYVYGLSIIFFVSGPSAKNHQPFTKKQSDGFSKLLFSLSIESFWEKWFSLKKKLLNFCFSDIERKIIDFFVEKISAWWSKLLYAFRKWSFEEKLFNQRNESFQVICDIERKNFGVWQKSFQQVCRNCILRVQRNRLRNFFFEKTIFLLFRVIGQKTFGLWQESLFCRIVKCAI